MDANVWSHWVQCHVCLIQMSYDANIKFQITSCGHIFCEVCVENYTSSKCYECGPKNVSMIPIGSKLPQSMSDMFQETYLYHVKHTTNMINKKENEMTEKLREVNNDFETIKDENDKIEDENRKLEKQSQEVHDRIKREERMDSDLNSRPSSCPSSSIPIRRFDSCNF